MKSTNFKALLKEWNSYLLKEEDASRVISMIDDLEKHNVKIHIENTRNKRLVISYGLPKNYNMSSQLHGKITCSDTSYRGSDLKGIGQGETNSCWEVNLTSQTTKGMGPLLYEVLIEYISNIKRASLKPDSRSVSSLASSVWYKFDNRPDIQKIQLDVDNKTVSSYRNRNKEITQVTPDIVDDDTLQHSAINDRGPENWDKSALSRSYKKVGTPLIDELKKRNLIVMPKVFKSKLGSAWG